MSVDRRGPLRIAGLVALLTALVAGIWSLWGPSPWDRWQYVLFPASVLLGALRRLVRSPRLTAAVDALGVGGLLVFLLLMSRWLAAEAEWPRLAALTPMTLAVAGFVLLRLKQIVRPA